MWDQATWWLVGGVAIALTAFSFAGVRDRAVAVFTADAVAALLWMSWSINSFAVERITNDGTTIIKNYPEFGYLGLALAFVVSLDLILTVLEAAVIDDPMGDLTESE